MRLYKLGSYSQKSRENSRKFIFSLFEARRAGQSVGPGSGTTPTRNCTVRICNAGEVVHTGDDRPGCTEPGAAHGKGVFALAGGERAGRGRVGETAAEIVGWA